MFDSTRDRAIDWLKVERWTRQLVIGESGEVCASLRNAFEAEPAVIWNPRPSDLTAEKARFLLDYWGGLRRDGGLPP